MRLDLGRIAKGCAADRVAEQLASLGAVLVDAGGDTSISRSRPNGDPWTIAVAHPFESNKDVAVLHLDQGGVASSGRNYRRWENNGTPQHHLLDPRTGRPAETDVMSATVIGAIAWQAEVAAKVVLIRGSVEALRWLEERNLAGLAILESGEVRFTPTIVPTLLG